MRKMRLRYQKVLAFFLVSIWKFFFIIGVYVVVVANYSNKMVIEVGITNVRYVTLEHSRPWVIHAYRNIKGRGLHKEEELESETVPLPSSSSGVTSSADNGVAKASADDVIHIETLPSKPSNISTLDSYDEQRVDPDNPSDGESRKRKLDESDVDGSNVNAERTGEEDGSASNPKKPRLDDNPDVTEESVKPTEVEMGEAGVTVGPPSELKTRATRKRKSSGGDQQPTTKGPQPTSTYDKVRLIIQPWRKPEGGINKPILKMMLESVMLFLMMKPGSTEKLLLNRYLPYLQPMMLENIVKILEEIGCLKRKFIKKTKCSLFRNEKFIK